MFDMLRAWKEEAEKLERGEISRIRYRNYCEIYDELRGRRPVYIKK